LAFIDKIVKLFGADIKNMPVENQILIASIPIVFILVPFSYWVVKIMFYREKVFSQILR